jgi:hypothetical protein
VLHAERPQTPPKQQFFVITNLRDTLLVLPPIKRCPGDPARVLALQEKTLGLAILESEDLAVTTDIELALFTSISICPSNFPIVYAVMCPSRDISEFRA